MDVVEALDRWQRGELSKTEVFMITGFRLLSELYREVQFDVHDRENEAEIEEFVMSEIASAEQAELECKAWEMWGDWLKEEPNYLEACVRMLRHAKQLELNRIGRRLSDAAARNKLN